MSTKKIVVDPENLIFAMDIGTRSIVGLVCYPEQNGKLHVLSTEVAFHPQRDMLDGQIHNIEGVFQTANAVKKALEKRLGITLKKVAIAAAGRALETKRQLAERAIEMDRKVRKEEIASLELEAVEKAQESLQSDNLGNSGEEYYCVGFTTVSYYLDGFPITSLTGQRGKQIGVEVLATFLPQVVVDSLLTVVEKLGLNIHNLTLEPIAALNVTIPQEYRTLNLALIDVGAGTSDIAITHKGAVIGYAMVPLAGDEITEKIADTYLLDFNTAEKIKLKLGQKKDTITFKDILGGSYNLAPYEIIQVIEPVVDKIAEEVSSTIKECNNGPPRALFFIGGGSQTPLLREKMAEKLELPLEKVAVRGREIIHKIVYNGKKLKGPESITPFGIALSALQKDYFGFAYVTVNEKVIRLLDTENIKVGNALIAAGYNSRKLLGRRGPSLKIFWQGQERVIPGSPGENARILINGEVGSLETEIKNNDRIEVLEARDGLPFAVEAESLFPPQKCSIIFNGEPWPLKPRLFLNGEEVEGPKVLKENDKVELAGLGSLGSFLELAEIGPEDFSCRVNGKECSLEYELQPGDRVEVRPRERKSVKEAPVTLFPTSARKSEAGVPGKAKKEKEPSPIKVKVNGENISLEADKPLTFADIFNHIHFDRGRPQGKLIMTRNGEPAPLTSPLQHGDEIAIYWEKEK